jgi:anhydro-N-acetylmuramic acid kinase
MYGLDIALCTFDHHDDHLLWTISNGSTFSFPEKLLSRLANATVLSGFDLMQLDADFGVFIGHQVRQWAADHQVTADYIASHGHTVFHEPALGFTTQIGSGSHIAYATGMDTITNFRSADIAAGGQGAPFAPAADTKLFPGYDAYLNLGGIANINIRSEDGRHKGWDIGPCNQALNFLARKVGKPFDLNGDIASKGVVLNETVAHLVDIFPFDDGHPKGLSNASITSSWIQYLERSNENINDLMTSTVEAITTLILSHISPFTSKEINVLVTGGGAHNSFLMKSLKGKASSSNIHFTLPAKEIIDYKECALMGYLGYLTIKGLPYGIKEITGAQMDTIGGAIYKAIR